MDGYIKRQTLQDIADAIREKNGSSDTYTPSEMANAIRGIEGGGGELSDLSLIGWNVSDIKGLSQNIVSCIAYSKALLDTWNPSGTSMQNKYNSNKRMVFPPKMGYEQC